MNAEEVVKATENFAKELSGTIGDNLVSTVLYGSVVKGDYVATTSDHNVALVLKDDHASTLRGIAQTMRRARPSKKTGLLILTKEELVNARDVFPLKLRDISRYHKVAAGDDVMRDMEFDAAHIALDCEQQLRSLVVRMRRLFIQGANDPSELRKYLVGTFKAFLPPMAGIIEAMGKGVVKTKKEVIDKIPETLDVPKGAVDGLDALMRNPGQVPTAEEANVLLDNYTRILKTAASKADAIGG